MKNILVVGAKGNMGQRYCRILDHIGHSYFEYDQDNSIQDLEKLVSASDGCIIATPTHTHCSLISTIYYFKPHIKFLVEKPLSKHQEQIDILLNTSLYPHMHITMINQYGYMFTDNKEGKTYYNYFKTGNDGLYWDCISIIALARGEVEIKNDSPIWRCMINGTVLDRARVDISYIKMIKEWLKNPEQNHDYIIEAHKKVLKHADSINSDPSKV